MIRLLKIEIIKIGRYRTFWVMLLLHLLAIGLIIWSLDYFIDKSFRNSPQAAKFKGYFPIYEFPDIWHNITYLVVFFRFLLGILLISLVTNEFSNKNIRQGIIDGLDRKDFVLGKVVLMALLSFISTIFVFLICTAYGFIITKAKDYEYFFTQISFIPAYFLQVMAYLSVAFLMASLIKRAGLAISALFVYAIAEQYFIARLYDTPYKWVIPKLPFNTPIDETNVPFGKYLLMSVDSSFTLLEIFPAVAYVIIFCAVIYGILYKTDL